MIVDIFLFILFIICIYFLINLMMNTDRMFVKGTDSLLTMTVLASSIKKEDELDIASLEDIKGGESFDRYDDERLYLSKISIKNRDIIIDGNNLLFYLKNTGNKSYEYYLDKAIEFCDRFDNDVYFVIKLNDKAKVNIKEKIKNKNLTVIISKGSSKSRDDYAVINLCSKLKNPLVLSRDRYRDVKDIIIQKPESYEVFGKHKNIMEEKKDSFNILGSWTITDYIAGFSHNEKYDEGLYELARAKNLYKYVYLFNVV